MAKSKKEMELNELNLLINSGFSFQVLHKVGKGFFKLKKTDVTDTFTIKEPTLAVLDLLSAEYIKIDFNPETFDTSENKMNEIKLSISKNLRSFAKIIAIAVLGEDYFVKGDKELTRLTELFFHTIQPSKLYHISLAIHTSANYSDFLSSMRLMSVRTTSPKSDRIELQD